MGFSLFNYPITKLPDYSICLAWLDIEFSNSDLNSTPEGVPHYASVSAFLTSKLKFRHRRRDQARHQHPAPGNTTILKNPGREKSPGLIWKSQS
jgi:hypothetical protein